MDRLLFPADGFRRPGCRLPRAPPWYYTLQYEDHPIEWAQFALCLFSSITCLLAGIRWAVRRNLLPALLMLLVAAGSLVLAGEEISWGQRVFGLLTPQELAGLNAQAEMNVHNIDVGVPSEKLFKAFEFGMGLGGVVLALLARRPSGWLHRTFWWLLAPPLLTLPAFAGMALYRLLLPALPVLPFLQTAINPAVAGQEWVEASLYTGLAVTAACCWRRSHRWSGVGDRLPPGQRDPRAVQPAGARARSGPAPLLAIGLGVLVVTVVFAVMTAGSGVLPGNH